MLWETFWATLWATLIVAVFSISFFVLTWRITDYIRRRMELNTFIKPLATETYLNLWRINRLIEYYDDLIKILQEPDVTEDERAIETVLSGGKEFRIPRFFVLRRTVITFIINSGSLRFFNLTYPHIYGGKYSFAKPDTVRELLINCIGTADDVESAIYWYNMVPGLRDLPGYFLIKNLETAKVRLIDSFNNLNVFLYILIWNSKRFAFEDFTEYKKKITGKKVFGAYLSSELDVREFNGNYLVVCWKDDVGLPPGNVIEMSGFTSILGTG